MSAPLWECDECGETSEGDVGCGCPGGAEYGHVHEQQCAYRQTGKKVHHRVPGCGMTWAAFQRGVWDGSIDVLLHEPKDSSRCLRCYSQANYRRHPL